MDAQLTSSALPPTFLLPIRARYFNSTVQYVDAPPPDNFEASQLPSTTSSSTSQTPSAPRPFNRSIPQPPPPPTEPLEITPSIRELLPYMTIQPAHYITVHIHGKPYLVTEGDIVRLPFHMPSVRPGDVLRLNRATTLGSRDYTMKGEPYLDDRLYVCRATVSGTESDPMKIKEKTKRRQRKVKTVKSKHKHTILRISELKIHTLEELEASL